MHLSLTDQDQIDFSREMFVMADFGVEGISRKIYSIMSVTEIWNIGFFYDRYNKDAHYMYTNARLCPRGFSKLTRALNSRDQELSNSIWLHRAVFMLSALNIAEIPYGKSEPLCNTDPQNVAYSWNSCPPDFGQWASLDITISHTFYVDMSLIGHPSYTHQNHFWPLRAHSLRATRTWDAKC